jgi:hypothetical protein
MKTFEEITKEEFGLYEGTRLSGLTNMLMIVDVMDLTGLDRETIVCIIENYEKLRDKFQKIVNKYCSNCKLESWACGCGGHCYSLKEHLDWLKLYKSEVEEVIVNAVERFFALRFPDKDIKFEKKCGYFGEWVSRWKTGQPEMFMDEESLKVFREMKNAN